MAELSSDLWAAIAEYTNNGRVLLAVDEHSRRAAERFCPDQNNQLAVQREMFMSAGAEPRTSCSYYYDDTQGWEEMMLYKRLDMELLFRMFWWFHKSAIAVHVPFEGDWKKKAKDAFPLIVDKEGTTQNERTNHYVTWEVLQAFHKGNYGSVRLLFTDEVIDETATDPAKIITRPKK